MFTKLGFNQNIINKGFEIYEKTYLNDVNKNNASNKFDENLNKSMDSYNSSIVKDIIVNLASKNKANNNNNNNKPKLKQIKSMHNRNKLVFTSTMANNNKIKKSNTYPLSQQSSTSQNDNDEEEDEYETDSESQSQSESESSDEIDSIPKISKNNNEINKFKLPDNIDNHLTCPICLDISNNAIESQCCNHIFCLHCIQLLFKESVIQQNKNNNVLNNKNKNIIINNITSNMYKKIVSNPENVSVSLLSIDCPICRKKNVSFSISKFARRMISSLPITCPYKCNNFNLTRGNINKHKLVCKNKPHECVVLNCKFIGSINLYIKHIIKQHNNLIVDSFEYFHKFKYCNNINNKSNNDNNKNNKNNNTFNSIEIDDEKSMDDPYIKKTNNNNYNPNNIKPVSVIRNDKWRKSRLGIISKYYCGGKLGFRYLSDSNGISLCGPYKGYNCISCMKLDLISRSLHNKKNYLINKNAFISKYNINNKKWYCGKKIIINNKANNKNNSNNNFIWDGYCGPNSGPNCNHCKDLSLYSKYYKSIYQ